MDLKTTTRPRRHSEVFRRMRQLLPARSGGAPLRVAEFGPGLAVKYLGRLTATEMPLWDVFRRLETGVRRLPMPDAFYENYETHELIAALDGIPFDLTVIDINPKVLRVIGRSLPGRPIHYVVADLDVPHSPALAPLAGTCDLVVAYAVVGRVRSGVHDNANDNVASLLKPGGILLGHGEFTPYGCQPMAGEVSFYRKAGAAAGIADR